MSQTTESPRSRYRKQVQDEIKTRAWEQIGQAGASALSLKAIATEMGMTAPALYRYYDSRDELLTQLILSTYEEIAEMIETAVDMTTSPSRRLIDIAQALRRWAVAHPQRYLLLYGTPVPGYHAPPAATDLAQRIFDPILAGFAALLENSADQDQDPGSVALVRSVTFWTRLHGVLSLQLAGHFVGMSIDTDQLYADEIHSLVASFAVRDITGRTAEGFS